MNLGDRAQILRLKPQKLCLQQAGIEERAQVSELVQDTDSKNKHENMSRNSSISDTSDDTNYGSNNCSNSKINNKNTNIIIFVPIVVGRVFRGMTDMDLRCCPGGLGFRAYSIYQLLEDGRSVRVRGNGSAPCPKIQTPKASVSATTVADRGARCSSARSPK